jgi:hypothetical protein
MNFVNSTQEEQKEQEANIKKVDFFVKMNLNPEDYPILFYCSFDQLRKLTKMRSCDQKKFGLIIEALKYCVFPKVPVLFENLFVMSSGELFLYVMKMKQYENSLLYQIDN